MENDYEIKPEKRIRVSTYSSDFIGKVSKVTDDYLFLDNVEEIYDHLYHLGETRGNGTGICASTGREEERRKTGRVLIPRDKINHYEFLEDE